MFQTKASNDLRSVETINVGFSDAIFKQIFKTFLRVRKSRQVKTTYATNNTFVSDLTSFFQKMSENRQNFFNFQFFKFFCRFVEYWLPCVLTYINNQKYLDVYRMF